MSVVLAVADWRAAQRAVDCLCAQTARARLELIVVAPEGAGVPPARGIDPDGVFVRCERVVLPALDSRAAANAEGARRARAPVVVFAEDHGFPAPRWAETLVRRHREPLAAVAPRLANANPDTVLSWCDLLVHYGPWLGADAAGARYALPGCHCAYKTRELRRYDDRLAAWLEVENEMHRDMVERGLALALEPEAVVEHLNVSRWSAWLPALFHEGRIYAAARAQRWRAARRGGYALAWPAIALLRWLRALAAWPAGVPGLPGRARLAPALLAGFAADALGQAAGYLAGAGDAAARLVPFELGRAAGLRPAERALLGAGR